MLLPFTTKNMPTVLQYKCLQTSFAAVQLLSKKNSKSVFTVILQHLEEIY